MQRDYSLDIIRILACLMVILMHSPYPNPNAIGIIYGGISYLTSPCIGLFFMVSGATLLPVKYPMREFLRRRLGKVIWPTLVWTSIYLLLKNSLSAQKNSILTQILSIPFSPQGYGTLWFMYTLIGLYLLAPIISPWIKTASQKELKFIVFLWIVTLFYPILKNWLIIREDATSMLFYFSGYIGYFVVGYYLRYYKIKIKSIILIILYLLCLMAFIPFKVFDIKDNGEIFWYLGPFTVTMALIFFDYIGLKISAKINHFILEHNFLKKIVISISSLSFGIYLIHIAIMRFFLWNQKWFYNINNCILQIIVCFTFTFLLSYLVVFIISKTKISKYVIGI